MRRHHEPGRPDQPRPRRPAAPEVSVEVHLANGLPAFTLVGLPDVEVREARDRVRAALQTSQFEFPQRRITVNLARPTCQGGGCFDLPIALGILAASGQIPADAWHATSSPASSPHRRAAPGARRPGPGPPGRRAAGAP
jgi:hypothetical protein